MLRAAIAVTLAAVAALAVGCGGSGGGAQSVIIFPSGSIIQVNGIIVDAPPGAVSAPVEALIVPLSPSQLPAAPPQGLAALAAGRFEVNLAQFNLPVTIIFPLSARLPAGHSLPLWQLQTAQWQASPFSAVVSADGDLATTHVGYFTTFAIFGDYAPLAQGASWTYRRTVQVTAPPGGTPGPEETSTVTAEITGTQTVGGLSSFVWSESAPSGRTLFLHRRDSAPSELLLTGIQEQGQALEVLDPPARLLSLPPAAGQTWEVGSLFDSPATAAVSAETITVGGKQYDAIKVHIAPASDQDFLDLWFAPQVGPVKWKQAQVEPGVSMTVIEMDLQSFSLP